VKSSYRFVALLATVALALGATTAFAHDGGGHRGRGHGDRHGGEILRSALVGSTPGTATPPGPVLFGVAPAGAPWTIGNSEARVRADRVRVRGEGLLLVNTGNPAVDGTTGPVQMVTAAVFCNDSATPAFTSAAVPLAPDGGFRVDEDVTTPLPSPCLAPAVLVRIAQTATAGPVPNGPYIAASGGNAPAPAAAADNNDDD
jgi:hypothetical protein